MTLEKAIEIQTINNEHNPNFTDADREKAHQLGIEALSRMVLLKEINGVYPGGPLPSQTEE